MVGTRCALCAHLVAMASLMYRPNGHLVRVAPSTGGAGGGGGPTFATYSGRLERLGLAPLGLLQNPIAVGPPTFRASACDANNLSLGGNCDAKNGCESGGQAFMCYSFAAWAVSDTPSCGFAAFDGVACGTCYQVQFTGHSHNGGTDAGTAGIKDKQMVVQVINIGGIEGNPFDLLIPGGDVDAMNGCSTQRSGASLGAQRGRERVLWLQSGAVCARQVPGRSGREDLMEGCRWFVEWFDAADNPNLVYKQTTCPEAITSRSGMRG